MRTAFKFSKGGSARYISHLDLMRTMNRAIRRAGLPVAWSQGFHPHIVLSFAQALGVGYQSRGEYMELQLDEACGLEAAVRALNGELPSGIIMTGAWRVDEMLPTLMAAVSAARWHIPLAEETRTEGRQRFRELLDRETIEVVKEGKNGPAKAEIRRGIFAIEPCEGGVELFLAAGSALNIRPELVAKAALGGVEPDGPFTRLELYAQEHGRHVPLQNIFIDGVAHERGKDHTG